MQREIDLAMIYGSAREGRFCDTVAEWAASEIERQGGYTVDKIDPAAADIAQAVAGGEDMARQLLKQRLDRADAFLVVVPEYNHSYPAPLKALIDSAKSEWQAKPVAFISYGGISGGLRAVEHLRNVFTELHAVGIRDGVSFANVWSQFDDEGQLKDPAGATKALQIMLARLTWWASALGHARNVQNYSEVAA